MDQSSIKAEIESLVRCRIDWPSITGQREFSHNWLLFDWYRCLSEVAVSVDEHVAINEIARYDELLSEFDLNVVRNLELRDREARLRYSNASERLSELIFLPPTYNGKHFQPGLSREQVIAKSRLSSSLFFEPYSDTQLANAFWRWFVDYFDVFLSFEQYLDREHGPEGEHYMRALYQVWDKFQHKQQFRLAIDAITEVGAVKGATSHYVCFDIAMSSKVVHAYPISQTEFMAIMPQGGPAAIKLFI